MRFSRFALLFAAISTSNPAAVAQGTFQVYVASTYETLPTVNRMWGNFTVTADRLFYGDVDVEFGFEGDKVQIFRSLPANSAGEPLFTLTPQGGFYPTGDPQDLGSSGWGFTVQRSLTTAELADLEAGNWWVGVDLAALPGRTIRGQVTAVPEPTIYSLLGCGASLLVVAAFRTRSRAR